MDGNSNLKFENENREMPKREMDMHVVRNIKILYRKFKLIIFE